MSKSDLIIFDQANDDYKKHNNMGEFTKKFDNLGNKSFISEKPKVENLGDKNFILKSANFRFANQIRRYLLTEIHSWAISEILIVNNSSLLTDEQLVARLTSIPIYYPFDKTVKNKKITLDVFAQDKHRQVTSEDFKTTDDNLYFHPALICNLCQGQSLNLRLKIDKNTSEDSVKYRAITSVKIKAAGQPSQDQTEEINRYNRSTEFIFELELIFPDLYDHIYEQLNNKIKNYVDD